MQLRRSRLRHQRRVDRLRPVVRRRRSQGLRCLHDQHVQDSLPARRPYDQVHRLLQLAVRDLLDQTEHGRLRW